jgi:drug/metabolite transporter (DMT)-like permease
MLPPMSAQRSSYTLGLLALTAAVIAWSVTGWFTRLLALDTATVLFWRSLFGALGTAAVLALVPASGGLSSIRRLGKSGLAYSALTAISMFFFIGALHHTSVAHVAIITALVPFVAAFSGWVILKERPGRSALIASLRPWAAWC